jgi:regulator of replication initiation timing
MTDFREEAYILEKMEITEDDEDDQFAYEEIKDSDEDQALDHDSDEEDLNNFDMLKAKTTQKL